MGQGISVVARSRKRGGLRGLLGKAPDAAEVTERVGRLARRVFGSALVDATPKRLTLALHPKASPATLVVLPDGAIELRAETSVGPAYHDDVIARVAPLLDELEYAWVDPPGDARAAFAAHVAAELARGATRIGMPADRAFVVEAAVLTTMGPRDAAWRDAVIANPAHAADAFAWWEAGPGRRERSIALHDMWLELPWREPLDEAELAACRAVDAQLLAARKADPQIELPYLDWAELLDWLGEDERAEKARARAAKRSLDVVQRIGYRRYPIEVEARGWSLVIPGAFVSNEEDARWWATDGDRAVELTSITVDGALDSAALLAVAPEVHPVRERFVDGERHARIETFRDGDIYVLQGLVAQAPHVGFLTCKSHAPDDAWALAAWRSLRSI